MKAISKLLSIVLVLGVFFACSEEVDYNPASVPSTAQVCFSASNPSIVEISYEESSFNVELRRINTGGDLTVSINAKTDYTDIFSIPSSVQFADGSDSTSLVITYNPTTLEYDDYLPITLTIEDPNGELLTPYGDATIEFAAGIPAPWTRLGVAQFSDSWLTGTQDLYDAYIEQHDVNPNRYRLVNAYKTGYNVDFTILPVGSQFGGITTTIDDLVVYDPFYITRNSNYNADVYAEHPVGFKDHKTEDKWIYNIVKQRSADGKPEVIQIAPFYYMDGIGGWNESQKDGVITIIFPGVVLADYSLSVSFAGRFIAVDESNHAEAFVTLGEDVEYAKVAMIEGDDVDAAIEAIIDGTLESQEINASGSVRFANEESGRYSFVAVAYVEKDVKNTAYQSFEYSVSASSWNSLGMALYTDDIITTYYNLPALAEYELEIQESAETPGLYRLVNPYGEAYPYNEPGDWDASRNYFMEINAADPQGVYIPLQDLGCDWGKYGNFYAYSIAANYLDQGYTLEEAKADGICGTLENGIITFPKDALLTTATALGGKAYAANGNGAFKVILPSARTASPALRSSSKLERGELRTLGGCLSGKDSKINFSSNAKLR